MTLPRWLRWTVIRDLITGVEIRQPRVADMADHIPHGPPLPGRRHEGPPIVAPEDAPHLEDDGRTL